MHLHSNMVLYCPLCPLTTQPTAKGATNQCHYFNFKCNLKQHIVRYHSEEEDTVRGLLRNIRDSVKGEWCKVEATGKKGWVEEIMARVQYVERVEGTTQERQYVIDLEAVSGRTKLPESRKSMVRLKDKGCWFCPKRTFYSDKKRLQHLARRHRHELGIQKNELVPANYMVNLLDDLSVNHAAPPPSSQNVDPAEIYSTIDYQKMTDEGHLNRNQRD